MEKVIQVLNQMQADGIIESFAIGGGIAAIYYSPALHTDDVDVFFLPVLVQRVVWFHLERIYSYLADLGYYPIKEGILIEDWPVQFVRSLNPYRKRRSSKLTASHVQGNTRSIFSAEHLAAELLRSGRPKDHSRVIDLIK